MTEAELIEKVARALATSRHDYGYAHTGKLPSEYIISAIAAIAAMREAMVPVGWRYDKRDGSLIVHWDRLPERANEGWIETPLFAWPEGGA